MIIVDLEHLESAAKLNEIEGGINIQFKPFRGVSVADFAFDALTLGTHGTFGGGVTNILHTAAPSQYVTGLSWTYSAIAIGDTTNYPDDDI